VIYTSTFEVRTDEEVAANHQTSPRLSDVEEAAEVSG